MKNVGTQDSHIRFMLGLSLFVLAYFAEGMPHWFLIIAGLVLFTTAVLRFCPVWFGFRINTHSAKRHR